VKTKVVEAVEQICRHFSSATVTTKEDGQGGAYVLVDQVDLGDLYTEVTRSTWIGFHIAFQYPIADVYPHHVRPDLARVDKRGLGQGMGNAQFPGFDRPSVQFSRRTKEAVWGKQTALLKLLKVIEWARTHPGG